MGKIINKEVTENGASYQIDFGGGMVLWFDVWTDERGDITGDWNQYIFATDDAQDMRVKAFQDANNDEAGAYNFSTALEIAANAYENDLKAARDARRFDTLGQPRGLSMIAVAFIGTLISIALLLVVPHTYCFEDGTCKEMNSYQYAYWNA